MSLIHIKTSRGKPVMAGEVEITPVARSWRLNLPTVPGQKRALILNRPRAVEIRGSGGRRQTLPVRDRTRRSQLAICAGASALALALLTKRKRDS
ncbi:MAG: hypothetical protein IBX61_07445 [Thermoleophilia bacterium]|nr:hypothetical protein [Thermoleophilia bacterium]